MNNASNLIKNKIYIPMLLLFITFFFYYFPTLKSLVKVWSTDDDYSYGYLIPLITSYLIWEKRKEIKETATSVNWLAVVPFLLFLVISLYGMLGSSPSAVRPTIPLILLSIVLFCFGRKMFKVLFFPLAFLIFMIPLSTLVQNKIGVPLKAISTKFGAVILRLSGISVFVEGNVIDLGVTQLQVVDACAGLRFILPLFALGVIFAHFFEKNRWKQIALAVITIPIAIITNGIRVGATGILAHQYGPKVAEGFFHGFSGWIVFVFAFALLFVFHFFVLKRFKTKDKYHNNPSSGNNEGSNEVQRTPSGNLTPVLICSVSFIIFGILIYSTTMLSATNIKGGLSSFPLTINEWQGKEESMDPEIIRLSGAEQALNATYANTDKQIVSLFIGYRGSPFVESENFFHSPNVCLPSAGWRTIQSTTYTIKGVPVFNALTIAKMVIEKMGQRQLVYYWFQTKNRTSYDVNINRFHLALHAIKRDSTHDLFIRPITPIYPGESIEDAEKRMDQFVRDMMTALLQFLEERQYKGK